MFESTIMAIVWLSTPAIVAIGSVGAGLAFHAISKLWANFGQQNAKAAPQNVRDAPVAAPAW